VTDEQGNIVVRHELARNAEAVARVMLALKTATPSSELDEAVAKIKEYMKEGPGKDILEIEDEFLYQLLDGKVSGRLFYAKSTKAGIAFRQDIVGFLAKMGSTCKLDEYYAFNRAVNVELTKLQIKSTSEQNDRLIMQAVNSIDDINKSTNIFSERIREWYGYHFPELTDQLVADHEFFLEIITGIGTRGEFTPDRIKALRPVQDKTIEIMVTRAKESMGGDFSPFDIKTVQAFANSVLDLYKARVKIENYVESLMETTCPNLSVIVGSLLGARLICLAGGLESLAKKPSSTIQVLGAEKALFRAIKTKGEPPKHGILFQAKEVRSAPFWQRGKVARLLAGKISIAARVDQVSKRYIADELLADIHSKLAEIQRKYPDKPAQTKEHPASRSDDFQRKPRPGGPQRERGPGGYKGRQGAPSRQGGASSRQGAPSRQGGAPSRQGGARPERSWAPRPSGGSSGGFGSRDDRSRPPRPSGGGGSRPFKPTGAGSKSFKQGGSGKPAKKYPPKGKPRSDRE
jgi:nucleolar protein 56